ncbi:unnamed protein product [Peniophora sp. CBMAI 1063]|nr:unnamed protein product [Peniophora sp. CBMAI 1063]
MAAATTDKKTGDNKRKLSTSSDVAAAQGEAKRTKGEDNVNQPESSNPPSQDARVTSPFASAPTVDVFLTYGDAMLLICDEPCSEHETIWRRSAIHEACAKVQAEKEKEEKENSDSQDRYRGSDDCVEHIAFWTFNPADEDHSRRGPRAQKLVDLWTEVCKTEKEDQRFYEVFMQRDEPQGEDDAALEVVLDYEAGDRDDGKAGEGTWWVTGFQAADETHPALQHFDDYMPDYY